MAGASASRSASVSSWEAKEDGVLLRDDEGQASEGVKVKLRSGRVLETRTRSFSYSSAARRSTFLYLKEGKKKKVKTESEAMYSLSGLPLLCCSVLLICKTVFD